MTDHDLTLECLTKMRARLSPPGAWIQKVLASLADGTCVAPSDPKATCWCIMGAYDAEYPPPTFTPNTNAGGRFAVKWSQGWCLVRDRLIPLMGVEAVAHWNDAPGRTQDEVLQLLDRAIFLLTTEVA